MFHKLSDLMPKLLKRKCIDTPVKAARIISKFKLALSKLGLEPLMSSSKAYKVTNKTLWIKTNDNICSQELNLKKDLIIKSINEDLGSQEITDLRYKITSLIDGYEQDEFTSD